MLFGRPPRMDEPGELAAAVKWASLEEALLALGRTPPGASPLGGALDWSVVDVRWDRPEMVGRGPWLAALESEPTPVRSTSRNVPRWQSLAPAADDLRSRETLADPRRGSRVR